MGTLGLKLVAFFCYKWWHMYKPTKQNMKHAGYLRFAMNEDDFKKNAIPRSQLRLILTFAILVHLFLPEVLYVPKKSSIYGNFNGEQCVWKTSGCWWFSHMFVPFPLRQQAVALLRFGEAPYANLSCKVGLPIQTTPAAKWWNGEIVTT